MYTANYTAICWHALHGKRITDKISGFGRLLEEFQAMSLKIRARPMAAGAKATNSRLPFPHFGGL
jgi:hypothetical protein